MAALPLLLARTAQHTYAFRRNDIFEVQLVEMTADLRVHDRAGRSCTAVALGPLLDPADQIDMRRQRGLIVPLRRQVIALLVNQVDALDDTATSAPLPALLRARLSQPWATGALLVEDELVVQIDLRAIAMGVAAQSKR